ncbi:hypothetical protein L218DRAFT_1004293 [Marasmius fiardii PR-910]|nr:hypothetical protein L218DRAFT_1004293 [Marasmius fiardii PR-910]
MHHGSIFHHVLPLQRDEKSSFPHSALSPSLFPSLPPLSSLTTVVDPLHTLPISKFSGFSAQRPKTSSTTRLLDPEIFGVDHVLYGNFSWLPHRVTGDDPYAKGRNKTVEYYTEGKGHVKWKNRAFVVGAPKTVIDYQVWLYSSFWMSDEERERLWGSFEMMKAGERIVKHVSGFTVIDNVYLYNGVVHIVTDEPASSFPDLKMIVTPESGSHSNWAYISTREARERLGSFAGIIKGISWMIMDTEPHNETLLGLQKLQYSVRSIKTQLPTRLIHPNLPTFSDQKPDGHDGVVPRRCRSDTGYHPYTLKAAFPTLAGTLFKEDWEDYVLIGLKEQNRSEKPGWVLETVVVGCAASFARGQSIGDTKGEFGKAFGIEEESGSVDSKRKDDESDPMPFLTWLERDPRFEVNIFFPSFGWREKMESLLEMDVLICLEAGGAAEAVWMSPGKGMVIVQGAQDGTGKAIVESLGIKYVRVSSYDIQMANRLPRKPSPLHSTEYDWVTLNLDSVTFHSITCSRTVSEWMGTVLMLLLYKWWVTVTLVYIGSATIIQYKY